MGLFSKQTSAPVRSISLPCRSHPSTERIEKLLNKVKTRESTLLLVNPSAETICNGFSQLTELYECLDDLVKTTSSNQTMKLTDEVLDVSVKLLDICSSTTDIISQTRQHLTDLGCNLRRNGGSHDESVVSSYLLFRNKLKSDVKGSMTSLKQVEKLICCSPFNENSENYHLISMIRIIREITSISTVILRLSLVFLATPLLKTKSTRKWNVVSRFNSNTKVVPEENVVANVNELQCLDVALVEFSHCNKHEFKQVLQKKIEASETALESINCSVELMSRRVIATRASLLNMVSLC